MTDTPPTLRDLFTQAMDIWRNSSTGTDYDAIWPILDQAAGFGQEAYDVSTYFVKGEDAPRRAVGADLLGRVIIADPAKEDDGIKTLVEQFESETDVDVLWSIVTALAGTHSPKVLDALAIRENDIPPIRQHIIWGLTQIEATGEDEKKRVAAIVKGMDDDDADTRAKATHHVAVESQSDAPEIREALSRRLFDQNDSTRMVAIYGMARLKDRRAVSVVQLALERPEVPAIIFAAAMALADPALLPALEAADRSHVNAEQYAQVVAACGGPSSE